MPIRSFIDIFRSPYQNGKCSICTLYTLSLYTFIFFFFRFVPFCYVFVAYMHIFIGSYFYTNPLFFSYFPLFFFRSLINMWNIYTPEPMQSTTITTTTSYWMQHTTKIYKIGYHKNIVQMATGSIRNSIRNRQF